MFVPEVIDNVKVGALIRALLKERNMTQEALANQLDISKSAVSQNLAGKSSFDLQNLIKIAELFNLSLEELLSQKTNQDRDVISEYERLTRKGLEALDKATPANLRIDEPDLYGKVLIEYVIDYQKTDMFKYLFDAGVSLYRSDHHHTRTVLLKIITFMLEKNLDGVEKTIFDYTKEQGAFDIEDGTQKERVFRLLNKEKHAGTVMRLMRETVMKETMVWSVFKQRVPLKVLTTEAWLEVIARYHLERVLAGFLEVHSDAIYHVRLIDIFRKHSFLKGLYQYIDTIEPFQKGDDRLKLLKAQERLKAIVPLNDAALFEKYLRKGYVEDYNDLLVFLIEGAYDMMIPIAFKQGIGHINYRKVLRVAVEYNRLDLLQQHAKPCRPAELNYLLAHAAADAYELMIFLIHQGAVFDFRNHNVETYRKVNSLMKHLLDKEGVSNL
ncbi:MAG: XRE family transcriptional regulator [Acholeplasmatales bacterium]|nr:MAG: XRE family transcriptional regulator [Acholeplasmatales bacterium]